MEEERASGRVRLEVEDLGRIAHADIEIDRRLTLFVGENNSGKSYLSTVVWAHRRMPRFAFRTKEPAWTSAFNAVERVAAGDIDGRVEVPGDWREWASAVADATLGDVVDTAFRVPMNARVRVHAAELPLSIQGDLVGPALAWHGHVYPSMFGGGTLHLRVQAVVETHLAMCAGTSLSTLPPLANALTRAHGPAFFPASRTALVQLLPLVVDRLLEEAAGGGADPLPDLTAPSLQFLRRLIQPSTLADHAPLSDLADHLERHALRGRVVRSEAEFGRFTYSPEGGGVALPMARSSAVVTELTPLVSLLREGLPPSFLVYEEPEAHLHPRLQRVVAQVLVRLAKRGTRVLVTTHSDTFVQQINNQLKLGAVPDLHAALAALKADLGEDRYTAEDALTPEDVVAYDFRFREDGRTEVMPLEVRPDGVVMPSFNDELSQLTREVLALNALIED